MDLSAIPVPSAFNATNGTAGACGPGVYNSGTQCDHSNDTEDKTIEDNLPEDIISSNALQIIETTIACGIDPLMFIIGTPGNFICCMVFWKRGLKDRMHLVLFSLGLVDFFCVVFFFLLGIFCPLQQMYSGSKPYFADLIKWRMREYTRGIHRGFLYSSGCLTSVIAVERCLCVTLPTKAATLIRSRTMAIIIVAVVVSVELVSVIIHPMRFHTVVSFNKESGEYEARPKPTLIYKGNKITVDLIEDFLTAVVPVINFITVSAATGITVVKLKRAIAWRKLMRSAASMSKAEISLSKMLIVVSIIFIVSAFPSVITTGLRLSISEFDTGGTYHRSFVACHLVSMAIGTMNSTVNVFIYIARSRRFRVELAKVLPFCFKDFESEFNETVSQTHIERMTVSRVTEISDTSLAGDRRRTRYLTPEERESNVGGEVDNATRRRPSEPGREKNDAIETHNTTPEQLSGGQRSNSIPQQLSEGHGSNSIPQQLSAGHRSNIPEQLSAGDMSNDMPEQHLSAGDMSNDVPEQLSAGRMSNDMPKQLSAGLGSANLSGKLSAGHGSSSMPKQFSAGLGNNDIPGQLSAGLGNNDIPGQLSAGLGNNDMPQQLSAGLGNNDMPQQLSAGLGNNDMPQQLSAGLGNNGMPRQLSEGLGNSDMPGQLSTGLVSSSISTTVTDTDNVKSESLSENPLVTEDTDQEKVMKTTGKLLDFAYTR